MTKFFNKWTRIFHRWIAIPTIIIIPVAVITKFSAAAGHLPPQLEQFQSILMLLLVISGTYLYFIPYIAKWQRSQRAKAKVAAQNATVNETNSAKEL